jgi:hypothetical protein
LIFTLINLTIPLETIRLTYLLKDKVLRSSHIKEI